MNRYVTNGVISDLRAGKSISLFLPPYDTVQSVVSQLKEQFGPDDNITWSISGADFLHGSGGQLRIITPSNLDAALGLATPDVMIFPHGLATEYPFRLDPRVELIEY